MLVPLADSEPPGTVIAAPTRGIGKGRKSFRMFDLSRFIDDGRAKTSVCTTLLIAADVIKNDGSSAETTETLLAEGILEDCTGTGGGLTAEQADWVTRE